MALRKLLVMLVPIIVASHAVTVAASELSLIPKLRLAEEYNDNIFTTRDNRESDYITHVNPSITVDYLASRLTWNLNYAPEYLKFARNSRQDHVNQYLNTAAKLTLMENLFYLKASDSYTIVSTNVAQDIANSGGYANRTSLNFLSISPYAEFSPDSQTLLTTGYFYNNWSYGNSNAIDKTENGVFLNVKRQVSDQTHLLANGRYISITPDYNADFSYTTLSLGIKREYAVNSFANLEGGYTLYKFKNSANKSSPYWLVNLQHDFGATKVSVSSGVSYNADAYQASSEDRYVLASLVNVSGRGLASFFVSYNEYINIVTNDAYSRHLGGGGSYEYKFTQQLSGSVGVTAGKYNQGGTYSGLPYNTIENIGIKYVFPYDLTAALTYSHFTWSEGLWSGNGSIETNRVMLELVMTFPRLRKTF